MFTWTDDRRVRYAAFFLLMVSISASDGALTRSIADPRWKMGGAAAASLDLPPFERAIAALMNQGER